MLQIMIMNRLKVVLMGILAAFPFTVAQATAPLSQTQKGLTYDVHPRTIWKSTLGTGFNLVPGLRVLVTNPTDKPLLFAYSCSGSIPLLVRGIESQIKVSAAEPASTLACTDELRTRWIAPGRTVMFRSFSWVNLAYINPGTYTWVLQGYGGPRGFPLTLKP